jgi:hypothetical protein
MAGQYLGAAQCFLPIGRHHRHLAGRAAVGIADAPLMLAEQAAGFAFVGPRAVG